MYKSITMKLILTVLSAAELFSITVAGLAEPKSLEEALDRSNQKDDEWNKPHAPYNLTTATSVFSVALSWLPGYKGLSGSGFPHNYIVRYRQLGQEAEWDTIPVTPLGSTRVTIRNLNPGSTYQMQVIGVLGYGEDQLSEIINARTQGIANLIPVGNTKTKNDATGSRSINPVAKPGAPWNIELEQTDNDYIEIYWIPSPDTEVPISHYHVMYKLSSDTEYKFLSTEPIKHPTTWFVTRNLHEGLEYNIRISAFSTAGIKADSEPIVYLVPRNITKGIVFPIGIIKVSLFSLVAIVLFICTVKIIVWRNRSKQG